MAWEKNLRRLRAPGRRRRLLERMSPTLRRVWPKLTTGQIVLDVGCGESADCALVSQLGCFGIGLDLFSPDFPLDAPESGAYLRGDARRLPLVDGSVDVVLCHAMIALLSPWDRWGFYAEAWRVLKPGGLFAETGLALTGGSKFSTSREDWRLKESGFHGLGRGLYEQCPGCEQHPPAGSLEEIIRAVHAIDPDEGFRETGVLLVAFIGCSGNRTKLQKWGFKSPQIDALIDGMKRAYIYNPAQNSFDLPWLTYYADDDEMKGSIQLVLDVLAIRGELVRSLDTNGEAYYSLPENSADGKEAR